MPNENVPQSRSEAARAFVEYLRQHPEAARTDPEALALRFGLDSRLVRQAVARIPHSERMEERAPSRIADHAGWLVSALDTLLDRAATRPVFFEVASFLVAFGLGYAFSLVPFRTGPGLDGSAFRSSVQISAYLVAFGIALILQMGVFYRRRMARFAAFGGLALWALLALPVMIQVWAQYQGENELNRGVQVLIVGLAMFLPGLIYAGCAVLATLAGGYVHLRRSELEWERMSRQELLERYFELQKRLDRSVVTPDEGQAWEAWPGVSTVMHHPVWSAAIIGLASGIAQVGIYFAFGIPAGDNAGPLAFDILLGIKTLAAFVFFGGATFLSGSAGRGMLAAMAYCVSTWLPGLIPLGGFGAPYIARSFLLQTLSLGFHLIIGAILGVGATIQRRAAREHRLQRDDQAMIVSEMLEIQWRLEEDATSVTVLVVDAAKSTAMKVGADPLDVEYSFREYQMWIAECCAMFGGRVHSVAGDGAVVAFGSPSTALAAARRIQTDVVRFNAELNRLPKPFRLRLGLHAGRVAGDLNDVQFSEVIDIAAHVESIAPVAGIAATGAVVSGLNPEEFLPLAREVDGQPVYLTLNPTEA